MQSLMQVDHNNIRGSQVRAIAVSFLVLAWIGVFLRIYTRAFIAKRLLWDDGFMVISLICYSMFISFVLVSDHYHAGRHDQDLTPQNRLTALQFWHYSEWSYIITMTFVKVALGISYIRIFSERWQRHTICVVVTFVVITNVSYMFAVVFQCSPVPFIWHRYLDDARSQGECLSRKLILGGSYYHSAIGTLSDFLLVAMPILLLWKEHIESWKRFWVVAIMSLGVVAIVATIIRLNLLESIFVKEDFLFLTRDLTVWSMVESGTAIFAVAISALEPLLDLITDRSIIQEFKSNISTVSWLKPSRKESYAVLNDTQSIEHPRRVYIQNRDEDISMINIITNTAGRSSIRVWHDPNFVCRESTQGIIKTVAWSSTTLEIDRDMTEPTLNYDPMTVKLESMPDLVYRT